MGRSSILGGEPAAPRTGGTDVEALGPSDSSDSGSDVLGARPMATEPDNPAEWGAVVPDGDTDSDASGTGERATAAGDRGGDNADILPDRVISPGVGASPDVDDEVAGLAGDDGEGADEGIEGTGDD